MRSPSAHSDCLYPAIDHFFIGTSSPESRRTANSSLARERVVDSIIEPFEIVILSRDTPELLISESNKSRQLLTGDFDKAPVVSFGCDN